MPVTNMRPSMSMHVFFLYLRSSKRLVCVSFYGDDLSYPIRVQGHQPVAYSVVQIIARGLGVRTTINPAGRFLSPAPLSFRVLPQSGPVRRRQDGRGVRGKPVPDVRETAA